MIGIGVGHRLRAVHQHPLPRGAARGRRSGASGRARDRHERPRGALRRRHRRHLAARPVRDRRLVHPRPRGRRVARGAVRDGRGRHAAPRGARLRRPHDRQVRAPDGEADRSRSTQLLGAVEPHAAGAPVAGRDRRLSCSCRARDSRSSRCASASPTPATTRRKFTTRRAVRPARSQGFGPGFNGPLLARHRDARSPDTPATVASSPTRSRPTPGVAQVSPVIPSPNGKAVLLQVVPKARRRTRARPSSCTVLRDQVIPDATRGTDLARARRRSDRDRRRPRRHARATAAVHVPRDPAVELHPADARVPLAARAAEGRDHEPAVDRRGVRRDRRDLPVGLAQGRSSASARRARSRRGCR